MYVQQKPVPRVRPRTDGEFGLTGPVAGLGAPGDVAAVGVVGFGMWALGLVVLGGVVIWVVRSVRR